MHDAPQHLQAPFILSQRFHCLAGIIKFPPIGQQDHYQDLICTPEDQKIIYDIITTVADNHELVLFVNRNSIRNLGAQINHVHPFKFLSTIFTHPALRQSMRKVFDDGFKQSGFMEGLNTNMNREADKGKLEMFLPDFAKEVGLTSEELLSFFPHRQWETMVKHMMQRLCHDHP